MSLTEAKQFVAHFITGEYTPEEYATFLRWLRGATTEELNAIADEHEILHEQWSLSPAVPSAEWIAQLEQKLDKAGSNSRRRFDVPVVRMKTERSVSRNRWFAAASVIVLVLGGTYLYKQGSPDGGKGSSVLAALSNTFSNPRGGELKQMVLPDGSTVWLNSASTLKYPSVFKGTERVVELSGEAFFEVVKNSSMPFRVFMKNAKVEVIGTHFDIRAYEDELTSKTTLIEGSVRIESKSQSVVLEPGQQAETSPSGTLIKVNKNIDADATLAWKNNSFVFNNEDLSSVMRELSRSYNVDIQLEPKVSTKTITGNFSRKDGLDKILEQLEILNIIHFKHDGNTVFITP